MEKNTHENLRAWIALATMIIVISMVLIYGFKMFFGLGRDALIAIIGATGSIVGGFITLIGVKMTINANEKQRKKEVFPRKIKHLEDTIAYLDKIEDDFEKYNSLRFDFRGGNRQLFFRIDKSYGPETTELFKKHTEDDVKKIRDELIFVDSYVYQIFLEFKYKIDNLYMQEFWDAEYSLGIFREDLVEHYMNKGDCDLTSIPWTELELNEEQEAQRKVVERKYDRLEGIYIMHMGALFSDLKYQLQLYHTEMITVLDY